MDKNDTLQLHVEDCTPHITNAEKSIDTWQRHLHQRKL